MLGLILLLPFAAALSILLVGGSRRTSAWIAGADRYYLQAFADRDAVPDRTLIAPTADEMREYRDIAARYVGCAEIRGTDDA